MQGLHLTADLQGCSTDSAPFTDAQTLRQLCLACVAQAGLQPVGELFHPFPGRSDAVRSDAGRFDAKGGVTGVVLLAESHLAVHTWPELGAVTLDVYVCNLGADNSAKAHALLDSLLAAFRPAQVERHALARGAALASRHAA